MSLYERPDFRFADNAAVHGSLREESPLELLMQRVGFLAVRETKQDVECQICGTRALVSPLETVRTMKRLSLLYVGNRSTVYRPFEDHIAGERTSFDMDRLTIAK